MKKRLWSIFRWVLLVWGGISLAGVVVAVSLAGYSFGLGNRDVSGNASVEDVRFVLNWCRLGPERIEEVVHSFESSRSMSGDHLDAYAIKVTHVALSELTRNSGRGAHRWHRGDEVAPVLDDALEFAGGWLHRDEVSWFPPESELRSSEVFVFPWRIDYSGIEPRGAQLIFVRPSDQMVFYLSAQL